MYLCIVITEILAVLSNKPEGSTDWRIKTTTAVTYLKVLSPGGVQHFVVPGSVIPDSSQQYTTAGSGNTAKTIMSASHSPFHQYGYNVTDTESGTVSMYCSFWLISMHDSQVSVTCQLGTYSCMNTE